MKISVDRELILRPLQLITGVVERRQTLPVLGNVLVVARNGVVDLVGTDLEVELHVRLSALEVLEEGAITVPARKIADIFRAFTDGARVQLSVEGDRTIVRSGRSRFVLSSMPAADFPRMSEGVAESVFDLPQAQLKTLIDKVSFSMAQQDVRFFLNGMLLETGRDYVRSVATDGHRLAVCTLRGLEVGSDRKQAIVPRKGVLELAKIIDGSDDTCQIGLGKSHLAATVGGYTLTTKLVDGQFPDYENVIPKMLNRSFVGDRDTLRTAFSRVAILSNEKYRGVRLKIEAEQLTVQASNPEQEEAEEILPVDYSGDTLEMGFNVSYLQDVLGVLSDLNVKFSFSDTNGSALIEGTENDDALYVVMPMRL
ncbi:MAG: DNA polymerase III subunit beta [Pseudomonadales bacterium]